MNDVWTREYLAEFRQETPEEHEYLVEWANYLVATENFDRRLPHTVSKRSGNVFFVLPWATWASTDFAHQKRKEHDEKTEGLQELLGKGKVHQLRGWLSRHTHEELVRFVEENKR